MLHGQQRVIKIKNIDSEFHWSDTELTLVKKRFETSLPG